MNYILLIIPIILLIEVIYFHFTFGKMTNEEWEEVAIKMGIKSKEKKK